MSVQGGIWNLDGTPVERGLITRMSSAVAEYGPDDEKTYLNGPVAMLYRPFHTTSESRREHQPFMTTSGRVVVWDGRLDNRSDLISQLHGAVQGKSTDGAIVAAAFEKWNTECFRRFIGDWALSVWNPSEYQLILARDYIGIRPLLYHRNRDRIVWCSYLAPLVQGENRLTISDRYVAGFLVSHPDADLTPYAEILSVPPGHFVRLTPPRSTVHQYWTFDPNRKTLHKTDAEHEEHFPTLFRQAVQHRIRTHAPIVARLTGGLVSSSIGCMAYRLSTQKRDRVLVDTFSY